MFNPGCKNISGANYGIDHQLLICKMRLKIKNFIRLKKTKTEERQGIFSKR